MEDTVASTKEEIKIEVNYFRNLIQEVLGGLFAEAESCGATKKLYLLKMDAEVLEQYITSPAFESILKTDPEYEGVVNACTHLTEAIEEAKVDNEKPTSAMCAIEARFIKQLRAAL